METIPYNPPEIDPRFLLIPFPPHSSLHPGKSIIGMLIAFINPAVDP